MMMMMMVMMVMMVTNLHNIYIALLQNIALQFTPPSVYNTANLHWSPAATLASASRLSIFFSGHWASIQRSAIKLNVRWASFNFRVEKKRWIQFTVMKYSEQNYPEQCILSQYIYLFKNVDTCVNRNETSKYITCIFEFHWYTFTYNIFIKVSKPGYSIHFFFCVCDKQGGNEVENERMQQNFRSSDGKLWNILENLATSWLDSHRKWYPVSTVGGSAKMKYFFFSFKISPRGYMLYK